MSIRNNDSFKKEMVAFWGLPSFGENVTNGWLKLGFIEFSNDFIALNRPNAITMPLIKTTTLLTVNSPISPKTPKTFKKSPVSPESPESIPASPARQAQPVTPARYTQDTRKDKLTVTVTPVTVTHTPVTKVLTQFSLPLRQTVTKPLIFRNFLLRQKS